METKLETKLKEFKVKKSNIKIMQEETGITLLVLVITIIVLLILAGITIGALTGDNGIISNSKTAKEETEIANEKEILEKATVEAMGKNKYGNIEENELQSELNRKTGEGKTEAVDVGEEFEVLFKESNRYYTIDKDGNIVEMKEYYTDKNPGDITIGEKGEKLDGNTEETAYQIWCIEDLCAFSNEVNSGKNTYRGKYVKLMQDLNFNSNLSYVNGNISIEGNIQSCNSIDELKSILTTGEGFCPIGNGSFENSDFRGVFDGNNKKIRNIYINRPGQYVGLFGTTKIQHQSAIIENIEVSGTMIGENVGGIIANISMISYNDLNMSIRIENCVSDVKIEGDVAGGIVGINNPGAGNNLIISNCINKGEIIGKSKVGGIIGHNYNTIKIINSYNAGSITGDSYVGGIIGFDNIRYSNIINSYNLGKIQSNQNAGGITGYSYWSEKSIENCYNIGEITGSVVGGIIGGLNMSNEILTTQNCYYLNKNISKGIGGWDLTKESQEDIIGLTDIEIKSSEILERMNNYVKENVAKEGVNLKKWIKGNDGYPNFE